MVDRRRFPRADFEGSVQVAELKGEGHNLMKNSFAKNISQVGMEIVSFDFYPVNEKIQLSVYSNKYSRLMQGTGRVAWIQQLPNQDKYRIGIELVELSRSTYQRLKNVVQDSILKHMVIYYGENHAK